MAKKKHRKPFRTKRHRGASSRSQRKPHPAKWEPHLTTAPNPDAIKVDLSEIKHLLGSDGSMHLSWIVNEQIIDHLLVPFRGFVEFVYGNLGYDPEIGSYFYLTDPLEAKYFLIRTHWSIHGNDYRQYTQSQLKRYGSKFYKETLPDERGLGYDFWIISINHQAYYNEKYKSTHQSFVQHWQEIYSERQLQYPKLQEQWRQHLRPKAEVIPELEKLNERLWKLCGDGYKMLPRHLKFGDNEQYFEFLGGKVYYTDFAYGYIEEIVARYENDAAERAAIIRDFYGLQTQFRLRGRNLKLDVVTASPHHPTLAAELDGIIYPYSKTGRTQLRKLLGTLS